MKKNNITFNVKSILATALFIFPLFTFGATFSSSVQILSGTLTSASIGNEISFKVNPSGDSGAVTYTLSDSFSGTTISNSNINSNGIVYWTPTTADAGTHNITINMIDQAGNTGTAYQQVVVPSPLSVTIENVSPSSSVNVNQTIFFTTRVTGFTGVTYSVSDSMSGSSLSTGSINSSGNFSWTPKEQDIGNHTVTVTATNSDGRTASASQSVTVSQATASIGSLSPSNTVLARETVTFTVSSSNFTNPIFTTTDSFTGYSVGTITPAGVFTWTPTANDIGVHTITVRVSDNSGNLANVSQKITVAKAGVTMTPQISNASIQVGSTLSFSATTTGFVSPSYLISDSFSGTTMTSSNIGSNGVFSWTPTNNDRGLHSVGIKVFDNTGNTADLNLTINVSSEAVVQTTTVSKPLSSTPAKKYNFTKALNTGSIGVEVSELQKRLTALGLYNGPITGTFGPMTKTAVKKLQAKYKLTQVGSVGPATRKVLNSDI